MTPGQMDILTKKAIEKWQGNAARILTSKAMWHIIADNASREDQVDAMTLVECIDSFWAMANVAMKTIAEGKFSAENDLDKLQTHATEMGQIAMEHLREFDRLIQKYSKEPHKDCWECCHAAIVENAEKILQKTYKDMEA